MARSQPEYEFFPPGAERTPAQADRPLAQRVKGLSALAPGDDGPYLPPGRLSAPPPNVPPVFERPAEPRPDARPWHVPPQGAAPATEAAPDRDAGTPWFRSAPRGTTGAPAASSATSSVSGPAPSAPGAPTTGAPPAASVPARPLPAFTAHSAGPTAGPATAAGTGGVALGRPARRRPGRVAVAGLLAVLVVGGAALAAVSAVPRYLERTDRLVWERTTVRIPRTLAGLPRITTSSMTAQAEQVQTHLLGSGTGQMISDLAVYGKARGARIAVVVARPQHPLEADERDIVRSTFTSAMEASGVVLTERDAGDLGGWFGCGVKAGRTTTCLAVDAGAVVSVTVTATGGSAVTVAREARAAVEQRTP